VAVIEHVLTGLNTLRARRNLPGWRPFEALRRFTNAVVEAMVAESEDSSETAGSVCSPAQSSPGFRCQPPEVLLPWVNIENRGLSRKKLQKLLLEEAGVAGIAGAAFGRAQAKKFCASRASVPGRKLLAGSFGTHPGAVSVPCAPRLCVDLRFFDGLWYDRD